jgi:hypothetical protein
MTETPLHDTIKAQFDDVQRLAHRRGYLEAEIEFIKLLQSIKRPTSQVKDLIEHMRTKNDNDAN